MAKDGGLARGGAGGSSGGNGYPSAAGSGGLNAAGRPTTLSIKNGEPVREPITKGFAKAYNLGSEAENLPKQGNKQGFSGSLRDLKKAIIKSQSTGVLGNAHMGGHSDVSGKK